MSGSIRKKPEVVFDADAKQSTLDSFLRVRVPQPRPGLPILPASGSTAQACSPAAQPTKSAPTPPRKTTTKGRAPPVNLTNTEKRDLCSGTLSDSVIATRYGSALHPDVKARIIKAGAAHWQERLNRGGGSRRRERGFSNAPLSVEGDVITSRKAAVQGVHDTLMELLDEDFAIGKADVETLLREALPGISDASLADTYRLFRYYYGWTWRTFGRVRCIAPSDIVGRLKSWSRQLFVQNAIRRYRYAVFGDETAVFIDGEPHGKTLSVRGRQPNVVTTNPKETVTVFLAGLYDVEHDAVYPLWPTVVFSASASERKPNSGVYGAVRKEAARLGGIWADTSDSGWVKGDVFPRMMARYLPVDEAKSPTALLFDQCTAHTYDWIQDLNCDPHVIPGGCTSAVQVHDRFINHHFKRIYSEQLSKWRIAHRTNGKISREQVLQFIKAAHDQVWLLYGTRSNTILSVVRKYIREPMFTHPWAALDALTPKIAKANASKCNATSATESKPSIVESTPPAAYTASPAAHSASATPLSAIDVDAVQYALSREEEEEEVDPWKKYRRKGTFLPSHCVDVLCTNVLREYCAGKPPSQHPVLWGVGVSQLMTLGHRRPASVEPSCRVFICVFYCNHFVLVDTHRGNVVVLDSAPNYAVQAREATIQRVVQCLSELQNWPLEKYQIATVPCPEQAPGSNDCGVCVVNNLYRRLHPHVTQDVLSRKDMKPEWKRDAHSSESLSIRELTIELEENTQPSAQTPSEWWEVDGVIDDEESEAQPCGSETEVHQPSKTRKIL